MRRMLVALLIGLPWVSQAQAADQVINLVKCQSLTADDLHAVALKAFQARGYDIEEDTPTLIVGEQDKLKVEVLIVAPERVVIRWKEGFGHPRDTWLRNLKTSFLWALTE